MKQKSNKVGLYTLALLTMGLSLCSCHKSKNNNSSGNAVTCKVAGIMQYGTDTSYYLQYYFSYNSSGTVSKISVVESHSNIYDIVFAYSNNLIIARRLLPGDTMTFSKDTIVLDDQKRVIHIGHISNGSGPSYEQFLYDDSGYVFFHSNKSYTDNYYNYTDTLKWSNGDITKERVYFPYDYYYNQKNAYNYSSQLYKLGNTTARINDYVNYGMEIYNSKHLITSTNDTSYYYSSPTDTTYSYNFDSFGNITFIGKIPKGQLTETKIVYNCQ